MTTHDDDGDRGMLEIVGDAFMMPVDDAAPSDGFEPLYFIVEPMVQLIT